MEHYDFRTDQAEVRRSRRLVISFIATVANYEYGLYWHLYLDGTIELEIKATGILSTTARDPAEERTVFGQTLNKEGVYAPIHQHILNVRSTWRPTVPSTASSSSTPSCRTTTRPGRRSTP